jgi:hypothetical protein
LEQIRRAGTKRPDVEKLKQVQFKVDRTRSADPKKPVRSGFQIQ